MIGRLGDDDARDLSNKRGGYGGHFEVTKVRSYISFEVTFITRFTFLNIVLCLVIYIIFALNFLLLCMCCVVLYIMYLYC